MSSSFVPSFAHSRLEAYRVAREALVRGEAVAAVLPRGHANLADQLRRALLSGLLGVAEGASRTGADKLARFRCARAEVSEAAAALDAAALLGLAPQAEVEALVQLLGRLYALLTGLIKPAR